jgi:phage baseplate assembly protein W
LKNAEKSFLGTGWGFPPTFNNSPVNQLTMVDDIEDIKESLFILMHTIPGERLMLPEYGCDLRLLVFESIDTAFNNEVSDIIFKAVLRFEPRIKFNFTSIDTSGQLDGVVLITIDYYIIATNTRNNIVFPFYLQEGTNI